MSAVKMNSAEWKVYRSTYRVRASVLAPPEGHAAGEDVTVALPGGGSLKCKLGQVLVKLPDGKIEAWDAAQLEREMELEANPPKSIGIEVV